MEEKKLTEEQIDKMTVEELREYLGLGKPIPKSAWKHPDMSGTELVRYYREKDKAKGN